MTPVHRRFVCPLISVLGVAAVVVAKVAAAHTQLRHAAGRLSVGVRDENNGMLPARLTFRPVGDTPALYFTTIDIALLHGSMGYFALADFDLATGKTRTPGFSLDFDAIEVLNGYQDADRRTMGKVISDWIGLLDGGKRVSCTGNSDSHHMTFNLGGYPRNYVAVGDVPVARLDPAAVAAAVKAGHSYFTTGPIVDAAIAGKGLGEVASVPPGKVGLHVAVRAANWISVNQLTVLGPGNTVLATRAIPSSIGAV